MLHRPVVGALPLLLTLVACGGCGFTERSFPLVPGDVTRIALASGERPTLTVREWLVEAQQQLRELLPPSERPPLLTDEFTDADGNTVDVERYYGRTGLKRDGLLTNWSGLMQTAQCVGQATALDYNPPPWPGFEHVWIPIESGLRMHADLGWARNDDGSIRDADCIVLLTGILGNTSIWRTRNVGDALRAGGFHVLAVELRGHGLTDRRYPDVPYTWGVLEVGDLLIADEWIRGAPHVRNTGLLGFCWGANTALLTAWYDNASPGDSSIVPGIRPMLYFNRERRHFPLGVLAFSPVVRFEETIAALRRPRHILTDTALSVLQDTIAMRMRRCGYPHPDGNLDRLIHMDVARSRLRSPTYEQDGLRFLRLWPYQGKPAGDKLERARMPVLIVHAANDVMTSPQEVVELVAGVSNPNVAALILPSGGHVGFASYARPFYYSLMTNFFDAEVGAAAVRPREAYETVHEAAAR